MGYRVGRTVTKIPCDREQKKEVSLSFIPHNPGRADVAVSLVAGPWAPIIVLLPSHTSTLSLRKVVPVPGPPCGQRMRSKESGVCGPFAWKLHESLWLRSH